MLNLFFILSKFSQKNSKEVSLMKIILEIKSFPSKKKIKKKKFNMFIF